MEYDLRDNSRQLKVFLLDQDGFRVEGPAGILDSRKWHGHQTKALLKALALAKASSSETTWRLVDKDKGEFSENYIRQAKDKLKKVLSSIGFSLEFKRGDVVLTSPNSLWCDAAEYERLVKVASSAIERVKTLTEEGARQEVWRSAVELLECADSYYKADLAGDEWWIEEERQRLRGIRARALARLSEAYEALQQMDQMVSTLERLLEHDGANTDAALQLLRKYNGDPGRLGRVYSIYEAAVKALGPKAQLPEEVKQAYQEGLQGKDRVEQAKQSEVEENASESDLVPFETVVQEVQKLEETIIDLEYQLAGWRIKKEVQEQTGEPIPYLERKVTVVEAQLAARKNERDQLVLSNAPSAYFRVRRNIEGGEPYICKEENS